MTLRKGSVVTGSEQDELVIVRHRPGYARRRMLVRLFVMVLVAAVSFGVAWFYHLDAMKKLVKERDMLRQAMNMNESSISTLTRQVGILEKGGQVDRQAADTVRSSIRSLEDQVDDLEEELAFYKSIMDPAAVQKGLKIHSVDFGISDQGPRSVNMRLMLTQVSDNADVIEGHAKVTLLGRRGDQVVSYTLDKVAADIPAEGIYFRFRYFQETAVLVSLPEGFVPERVDIVADSSGRKAQHIEASFDWPTVE